MTDEDALLAANVAYYQAFGSGAFAQMSRIWADEGVSCIHPGWPVLIGRQAVLDSYRNILRSPNREWIEPRNETVIIAGNDGRVHCVEFVSGTALAATNWFRQFEGEWRMIHHQASPIAALVEGAGSPAPSQRLN